MRVVFDARAVGARADGLSNYIRALLDGFAAQRGPDEFIVLAGPELCREAAARAQPGVGSLRWVETPVRFMGLGQQVRMPAVLRRLRPTDLYHYPHFDLPLWAHPRSVVSIYDVNHLTFDGYFRSQRLLKRAYSWAATRASVERARSIITISEHTKQQLLERFPQLDPGHVQVIYFGVDDRFWREPADEEVAAFRRRHGLGQERVILYVGTHRPHKNVRRLVEAYALLRRDGAVHHPLVLVGSADAGGTVGRHVQALGLTGAVRLLGHLGDQELPLAYRIADAFVFCSLSEGFGMPLLEAMASDVPIVTSRFGAMAEVAGGCSILVDPYAAPAIAEGIVRVLEPGPLRRDLIARGAARAAQFRWEDTVRRTLDVYRGACGAEPAGGRTAAATPVAAHA